jgi:hypothetical protein
MVNLIRGWMIIVKAISVDETTLLKSYQIWHQNKTIIGTTTAARVSLMISNYSSSPRFGALSLFPAGLNEPVMAETGCRVRAAVPFSTQYFLANDRINHVCKFFTGVLNTSVRMK